MKTTNNKYIDDVLTKIFNKLKGDYNLSLTEETRDYFNYLLYLFYVEARTNLRKEIMLGFLEKAREEIKNIPEATVDVVLANKEKLQELAGLVGKEEENE